LNEDQMLLQNIYLFHMLPLDITVRLPTNALSSTSKQNFTNLFLLLKE